MKKLYSLLVLALCLMAGVSANAQTVVFDFAANPWQHPLGSGSGETAAAGNVDELAAEGEGYSVLLTCGQGTAQQPPRMWTGPQFRVYNGNTITLKPVDSGKAIIGVTFTATGSSKYGITTTEGTLNGTAWTGNHTEITFTGSKTNQLTQITVELADVNGNTVSPGANVTMPSISPRNNTNRTDSVIVTITGDSTTAIYYTLDGNDPTDRSTRYTEPFKLTESCTVKAIAYNAEGAKSAIAEVTYTITPSESGGEQTDTTSTEPPVGGKEYFFSPAEVISSGSKYLFVANVNDTLYVAKPITSGYGYLKVEEAKVEDGLIVLSSLDNAFTIAQSSDVTAMSFTIAQSDNRLLYQKGTYNSFNVDTAPTEGQYWSIDYNSETQNWTITNPSVKKYIQYSASHKSFGSYADEQGICPLLYVLSGESEGGEGGEQTDTTTVDEDYVTITFPFSQNPWQLETGSQNNSEGGAVTEPIIMEGVTFTADNGGGNTVVRMWDTNGNITLRTYNGTAITFSIENESQAIYKLVFDANGMNYTSEVGEIDVQNKTWTGNATSVTLAANKTTQVKTVTVYLGDRNDDTIEPGIYVAAPVISPSAGEKNDSVTVSIKAGDGAYIYYTLDGSEPDWNATLYTEPFKLFQSTTVKAIAYDDEGNPSTVTEATYTINITESGGNDDGEGVLFSDPATSTNNQFIVDDVNKPEELSNVWRFDSKYGAVASGYDATNKQNLVSESVLKTPVIEIPELDKNDPEVKPMLSFDQAIGYVSASQAGGYLQVKGRFVTSNTSAGTRSLKAGEEEWQALSFTFPELREGKNFSDFAEVEIDLTAFAGKSIEIGFFYKSDTEVAPTWEVRNVEVTFRKKQYDPLTAIDALVIEPAAQANGVVYDLQGRRVQNPTRGLYIVGGRKVYIK